MSLILFGVLAFVWAVLLLPVVRGRRRYPDSPARSVWRFGRAMDILAQSRVSTLGHDGRWVLVPPTVVDTRRRRRLAASTRRRRVAAALAALAVCTAAPAVLRGGPWLAAQAGADLLLVAYCAILVHHARRRAAKRVPLRLVPELPLGSVEVASLAAADLVATGQLLAGGELLAGEHLLAEPVAVPAAARSRG